MKNSSLYVGMAARSAELGGWVAQNIISITGIFALLAMEALVLFAWNPKPEHVAAVGAVFCFVSLWLMAYVISIGQDVAQSRKYGGFEHSRIGEHIAYTNAMAISLLMGVVAVEVAIRLVGGLWGPTWLMIVHFAFVVSAVVMFVTVRFFLTGEVDPARHKRLAYVFTVLYFSTLFTGSTLLLQKFPLS